MISETLLCKATATDGRILRDRVLSGFGVRLNARKRTFLIATSVCGKQFRMMLGYWPLMSVAEARSLAMDVLRQCRNGERPSTRVKVELPTLRQAYLDYCKAKKIKASSQKRYESLFRTHFGAWLDRSVADLGGQEFFDHCRDFAGSKGKALVEIARGVVTALIRFVNAVHGLALLPPFPRLAAAGLLPERAQPRARVLQISDLPAWKVAVDQLGERQQIDLTGGVLTIPTTKNGKPHSLPITPMMREILERRCLGLEPDQELFKGVAAEHLYRMAMRLGAPRFMLHDLRKLVATVGESLKVGDAVLRRILNHTAPKTDVLHRHYVGLDEGDVLGGLVALQGTVVGLMTE
jgi:hypothetical protein